MDLQKISVIEQTVYLFFAAFSVLVSKIWASITNSLELCVDIMQDFKNAYYHEPGIKRSEILRRKCQKMEVYEKWNFFSWMEVFF